MAHLLPVQVKPLSVCFSRCANVCPTEKLNLPLCLVSELPAMFPAAAAEDENQDNLATSAAVIMAIMEIRGTVTIVPAVVMKLAKIVSVGQSSCFLPPEEALSAFLTFFPASTLLLGADGPPVPPSAPDVSPNVFLSAQRYNPPPETPRGTSLWKEKQPDAPFVIFIIMFRLAV